MTLKQESTESEKNLNNVIKIDPRQIQNHLGEMVRGTVEETLNSMLGTGETARNWGQPPIIFLTGVVY